MTTENPTHPPAITRTPEPTPPALATTSVAARRLLGRLVLICVAACSSNGTTDGTASNSDSAGGSTAGDGGSTAADGGSSSAGSSSAGAGGSSPAVAGSAGTSGTSGSTGGAGGVPGAGGAGGAPPNELCHAGKACAPDDTCSYLNDQSPGGSGPGSIWCECQSGLFACGIYPQGDGGPPMVLSCVYGGEAPCPSASDPQTLAALGAAHTGGCPIFTVDPTVDPTTETSSDGTPACCYHGSAGYCNGRPMTVAGHALVASLVRGGGWNA